jgi:HSP20 family protein
MTELGTKRQRSEEENLGMTPSERTGSLARRQAEGIGRGVHFPAIFSVSPGEFFTMSPITLMRRFTEDIDRAFSGLRGNLVRERGDVEEYANWIPAVELRQSGNNFMIHADLPGLSENDVKVEVTDDGLLIEGERKRESSSDEGGWHRSERVYGRFSRLIPLPQGARVDEAKANFNNGVLEIVVPVPETESKRRQIPIGRQGSPPASQAQAKVAGR